MSNLSDVTILITSFLRPGYLCECIRGIFRNLPDCALVVVDDGDVPFEIPDHSDFGGQNILLQMEFDSGLSAKRNRGVHAAETKYVLLGCDDFDFGTKEARRGIEVLVETLDGNPSIDVAGGRVDNRPYEGYLEYIPGEYIKETRLTELPPIAGAEFEIYYCCDLTVNYFLARAEVLRQFPWPEEMKIGGEHVCLFLDLKLAGKRVAWVKGVNINTQPYDPSKQDPRYAEFRARARTLGHRLMMKRYGILEYIGF